MGKSRSWVVNAILYFFYGIGRLGIEAINFLFNIVWGLLMLPFDIIEWLVLRARSEKKDKAGKEEKMEVRSGARNVQASYSRLKVISEDEGSLDAWEKKVMGSSSVIGIIVGARGSGKTAFGIKLMENVKAKSKRTCYALGFEAESMPRWINVVEKTGDIPNGALVLIDEGGILFSSRRAMTNANKLLGDLLLISRHKNLSILFISQNTSNLDVNIIRQADYIVLKPSSLLQKDFERKIIRELYEKTENGFKTYKRDGLAYLYADSFKGFVTNELPSFWSQAISTSFKDRK